ncbi:DUF6446 family protein [Roseovarius sp.]|uniref:DUF6446 family protein n=1 Tax=Roseovarius sp. TaxID=1486281 RepID=UPI003B5ABED9
MGKVIGIGIVMIALLAGAAMYYLQVYHFYEPVEATGTDDVRMVNLATGAPEPVLYEDFRAIDAASSPIRYRACFTTEMSQAMLTETYEMYEGAEPLTAPGWFDCFDAEAIAEELESGTALAFLGEKNIHYGIDRIVVVAEDGRGYAWHELNECGDKAYDGTVVGEECPPREDKPED